MSNLSKRKVYIPPDPDELETIAGQLRESLDENHEFEAGFGNFLKVLSRAYANNLSREQNAQLDKRIE